MASLSSSSSVFGNLADQARTWWETSSSSTKIISVGLAVILVMALIGAGMLATAPDYQDLFTNLDPQDAAAIAGALDNDHVKYELADNDTTIRVPAAQKDQLRMEMVSKGLPSKSGSVLGSDFLDKIGPGTTTDLSNQYIRMANESELSTTIGALDEIGSATVHLSPGNDSPFAGDSSPASASVVVGLKPGMALSNDQVMGIANLVAKSVPGLDLKNVVVVDTNGDQLWDGGTNPNGPGGVATTKILEEQQYSEAKRKEYQSQLDDILGPHKSLVIVNVELNYDQTHTLSTKFDKGPPVSSQDNEEKFTGPGSIKPGGPAGLSSNAPGGNIPTYPTGTVTSSGGGNYDHEINTTNFENTKTQTETQPAQGSIQREDVAVLIDSSIPADTVNKIQSTLQNQVGVVVGDTTRAVTVQSVPFSNTAVVAAQSQANALASQERMASILRMVAVAVVVGVLLFIFLRAGSGKGGSVMAHAHPHPQPMLATQPASVLPAAPEPPMLEEEPLRIEDVLAEMPEVETRPRRRPVIPSIEEHVDVKLESMRDMARHSPQSVALLIKGWMAEEIGES